MRLQWDNGRIRDADKACDECDTAGLAPVFNYCPFCGSEL